MQHGNRSGGGSCLPSTAQMISLLWLAYWTFDRFESVRHSPVTRWLARSFWITLCCYPSPFRTRRRRTTRRWRVAQSGKTNKGDSGRLLFSFITFLRRFVVVVKRWRGRIELYGSFCRRRPLPASETFILVSSDPVLPNTKTKALYTWFRFQYIKCTPLECPRNVEEYTDKILLLKLYITFHFLFYLWRLK